MANENVMPMIHGAIGLVKKSGGSGELPSPYHSRIIISYPSPSPNPIFNQIGARFQGFHPYVTAPQSPEIPGFGESIPDGMGTGFVNTSEHTLMNPDGGEITAYIYEGIIDLDTELSVPQGGNAFIYNLQVEIYIPNGNGGYFKAGPNKVYEGAVAQIVNDYQELLFDPVVSLTNP